MGRLAQTLGVMKLEVTATPSQADEEFVIAGTRSYNRAFAESDGQSLCVFARDEEGTIIGGVIARTYWQYLEVKFLWVHEHHRKEGLGSKVMHAAETEALRRGCTGAFLDTLSFQARGFYEKLGYAEFGRLPSFSGKHERHFMQKSLRAAAA